MKTDCLITLPLFNGNLVCLHPHLMSTDLTQNPQKSFSHLSWSFSDNWKAKKIGKGHNLPWPIYRKERS